MLSSAKFLPPAYVINLDGSTERLRSATEQLNAFGITFERVPAFDGRNLASSDLPDYDRDASVIMMGRELTGGEVGCYLSHLEAARRFLESNQPYGIVFEDDVCISSKFTAAFPHIMNWLSTNDSQCDLLHLGPADRKIFTPRHDFEAGGSTYEIYSAHYFPMCTSGLLWSREGALRFVTEHYRIIMPVDHYFRYWQARHDQGYAIFPALVKQASGASDIDAENGARSSLPRLPRSKIRQERRNLRNTSFAAYHRLKAMIGQ